MAMVGVLVLHHYLADKADGRRLGRDEEASQDDGAKPFRAAQPHGGKFRIEVGDSQDEGSVGSHRLAGSTGQRRTTSAGASFSSARWPGYEGNG